ncbi:MAG: hypothetical protein Q4D60_11775, partial [Eubacteriales bacterium]|nr:hypothetical protein [Eubacteriales bacterium]
MVDREEWFGVEKDFLIIGVGSLGKIAKEMGTFQEIDFLDGISDLAIGKFLNKYHRIRRMTSSAKVSVRFRYRTNFLLKL